MAKKLGKPPRPPGSEIGTSGPPKTTLPPVGRGRARARLRKLGMELDPAGRTRLKRKVIKKRRAAKRRPPRPPV